MTNVKDVTIAIVPSGAPVLKAEWKRHSKGSASNKLTTLSRTFAMTNDFSILPALRVDNSGRYYPIDVADVQVYQSGWEDHFFPVDGLTYLVENMIKVANGNLVSNTVTIYLPQNVDKKKLTCSNVTHRFPPEVKERLSAMFEPYTLAIL